GHLLRLSGGLTGWAPADRVVPLTQGIEFFTGRIQANPNDAFGYAMRALLWAYPENQPDKAMADCDRALELSPKNPSIYVARGIILCRQEKYDQAISAFDEAIRLNPRFAVAYSRRSGAWQAKKNLDRALADAEEALRIEPERGQYHG